MFPLTGYFPFLSGAAGYRFFVNDAIRFEKSLRVTIGFGVNENPSFRQNFSKPDSTLHFSSVAYWYQVEPHAPLPPLPSAVERAPVAEITLLPSKEQSSKAKGKLPAVTQQLPTAEAWEARAVRLAMFCGRPEKEVVYASEGYAATVKSGYAWQGWSPPVYHARADMSEVQMELTVPKGAKGMVRVYVIDPDHYQGGRKQVVSVARTSLGLIEGFQSGRWLEQPVSERDTVEGRISIRATNAREGSNAVISLVEWIEKR